MCTVLRSSLLTAYFKPVCMYTPPVYITVRTVHAGRNIISSPATFAYFICMYAEISTSTSGKLDVKRIHAAYRRAYVLSLLTWPRTCTRPRHAHRGSEALSLSRASC